MTLPLVPMTSCNRPSSGFLGFNSLARHVKRYTNHPDIYKSQKLLCFQWERSKPIQVEPTCPSDDPPPPCTPSSLGPVGRRLILPFFRVQAVAGRGSSSHLAAFSLSLPITLWDQGTERLPLRGGARTVAGFPLQKAGPSRPDRALPRPSTTPRARPRAGGPKGRQPPPGKECSCSPYSSLTDCSSTTKVHSKQGLHFLL